MPENIVIKEGCHGGEKILINKGKELVTKF